MKKIFVILISIVIPSILFAQQKTGNLTVFSEDGDKFYLFLNGEKQNDIPQTNIRVEELPQPYYRAKIVFEDQTLTEISKNLPVADADDVMMDVTYRLRKDKNKKVKLNPYSSIEVAPEFIIPAGMYVRKFGQPQPTQPQTNQNQVGYQTTTKTSSNTMNANVNVPGLNMNISINDPNTQVISSTTTTTTRSNTTGSTTTPATPAPPTNKNCTGSPMNLSDFAAAKKTIKESSFNDTKLSTAKSIASANCLNVDQVVEICKLFSFEEAKLDFAKYAYKYTTDPKNYFKVNSVFSFSSSKEELNDYITANK